MGQLPLCWVRDPSEPRAVRRTAHVRGQHGELRVLRSAFWESIPGTCFRVAISVHRGAGICIHCAVFLPTPAWGRGRLCEHVSRGDTRYVWGSFDEVRAGKLTLLPVDTRFFAPCFFDHCLRAAIYIHISFVLAHRGALRRADFPYTDTKLYANVRLDSAVTLGYMENWEKIDVVCKRH